MNRKEVAWLMDGNAQERVSRNDSKDESEDRDQLSINGVDHKGLVTERDIDTEFGLFEDEVPTPGNSRHKR
ncbi:MAG: hypothetical protein K0Q63_2472 [Paenibacillus sp.]|jgi:hypothetical protein|nr:hypothetical protein [Paenibacillus sp.]